MRWVLRRVAPLVRRASAIALARIAVQRQFLGLTIIDLTHDQQASRLFGSVEAAIGTVREADPRRFERICRDVKRVGVMRSFGSAGEYWPQYEAIALDVQHLEESATVPVSLTIVHEATHARITRWGVGKSVSRERTERACLKQEIVFARKLPGSEPLIEGVVRKLNSKYWEEQDDVRRFAQRLERSGTPAWLRRFLVWLYD
jgi:hypothetical protein